jgi:hypothetical protein
MPLSDLTLIVTAGCAIKPYEKPFVLILSRRVGVCVRNPSKKELAVVTRPLGILSFERLPDG